MLTATFGVGIPEVLLFLILIVGLVVLLRFLLRR